MERRVSRIEWRAATAGSEKALEFLDHRVLGRGGTNEIRMVQGGGSSTIRRLDEAFGGGGRFICAGTQAAVVTLVHKGNIQKFYRGAFRRWGAMELAVEGISRRQERLGAGRWILTPLGANSRVSGGHERGNDCAGGWNTGRAVFTALSVAVPAAAGWACVVRWYSAVVRPASLSGDNVIGWRFSVSASCCCGPGPRPHDTACWLPRIEWRLFWRCCAAQVGGLGIAPGSNIGDGFWRVEGSHMVRRRSMRTSDVHNPRSVM